MKLINVGNFLKRYEDNIPGDTIDAIELRMVLWLDEPAVEAIPIEWLKKKYEEADDMGMGIEDWSEKDCFGHVIKEWEKENELLRDQGQDVRLDNC